MKQEYIREVNSLALRKRPDQTRTKLKTILYFKVIIIQFSVPIKIIEQLYPELQQYIYLSMIFKKASSFCTLSKKLFDNFCEKLSAEADFD